MASLHCRGGKVIDTCVPSVFTAWKTYDILPLGTQDREEKNSDGLALDTDNGAEI